MCRGEEFSENLEHGTNWILAALPNGTCPGCGPSGCTGAVRAWLRRETSDVCPLQASNATRMPEWRFRLALLDAWLFPPQWIGEREVAGAFAACRRILVRYLRREGIRADDANDLAQDMLTALWAQRNQMAPGKTSAYLLGIVKHQLRVYRRNMLRSARLGELLECFPNGNTSVQFVDDVAQVDAAAVVKHAVQQLPPSQQCVTELILAGNTPAKAAQIMGITRQSGHKLLKKAIARIRTRLNTR